MLHVMTKCSEQSSKTYLIKELDAKQSELVKSN